MKLAALATLLSLALAGVTYAASPDRQTATVVLDAPPHTSRLSLATLESELASIPDLHYDLAWVSKDQLGLGREVIRPIQVRFEGRCNMQGVPPNMHTPGPYAWAHVSDGRVLPFIEVDCDRIRGALFSVMWGEDFQHRDFLFARAVARVLAHELHHVLDADTHHSHSGLAKPALTASNLIRGEARLYSDFGSK